MGAAKKEIPNGSRKNCRSFDIRSASRIAADGWNA
jgi:hypothetical protein